MLKIFSIFKNKKDILDKNNSFIIFSIYSDKIEAFLIEKNKKISIKFLGAEPQEGIFSGDNVDINKLKLNCSKLKVKISEKNIKINNIIFGVSSEIIKPVFISKSIKRSDDEKKIKKDEISKIIFDLKKAYKKKNKILFLNEAERYFIDGYNIKNPIDLLGESLKIDGVGFELEINLNKALESLADFLGFKFFGVFALDTVLFLAENEFKKNENSVSINILNNHISIFLVKKGQVVAIDNLDSGYGFFEQKISKDFSIGIEEARTIKNKFSDGNLDVEIMEKLRDIALLESQNILNKVRGSLASLDQANLLPKNIFISFSSKPPLQIEQAFKKGNNWFSDLPFPQDVDIIFLNTIDMSGIINKGLSLSETNRNLYTNILVDGILKNINNFK
jgi:cell division ATPase FtsA